jgi:hypothetical protein
LAQHHKRVKPNLSPKQFVMTASTIAMPTKEQINIRQYKTMHLLGACLSLVLFCGNLILWARSQFYDQAAGTNLSFLLHTIYFGVLIGFVVHCHQLIRKYELNEYMEKGFKIRLSLLFFASSIFVLLYLPSIVQLFFKTGLGETVQYLLYTDAVANLALSIFIGYLIYKTPSLFRITKHNFEELA